MTTSQKALTKQINFIDRFIINITDNKITCEAYSNHVPGNLGIIGSMQYIVRILFYVAHKLNFIVSKELKDYLYARTDSNSIIFYNNKSYLDDCIALLQNISAKYNADPVIKSMMTGWTLFNPFPKSYLEKATIMALHLKRKYVNKQGYIKKKQGHTHNNMSASYILHNSFFNMYEISYFSYPKLSNMYTGYNFVLNKLGTVGMGLQSNASVDSKTVDNGLFVLVDLLNLMSSSLDITKPTETTNNEYTDRVNVLKNLCKDLIRHINTVDPDPRIKSYTDNTFLQIKTILDQLDKLYKKDPVFRGFIDRYANFTAIQFIQLPSKPLPVWRDIKDIRHH